MTQPKLPHNNAAFKLHCATRVVALVEALRAIPPELAPVPRAVTVAIREQIYFGWEKPLAKAQKQELVFGKYERDGWWSVAAAELVNSGGAKRGDWQLARDHVFEASTLVRELMTGSRSPQQIAELLDARLVTCTLLATEHKALRTGDGWERYRTAGVEVQSRLSRTDTRPPGKTLA